VGGRFLQGAYRPRRPVPLERSLPRQQSPARSHRLAAGLRGRPAGVLVHQPRAPARHRGRDPRGLQPGRHRDLAGRDPHQPAQALRPRRAARRRAADGGGQRAPPAALPRGPPGACQGDGRAVMGPARSGERRLLKLVDDYGLDIVLETIGEILDGAERQSRECIRGWKDGGFKGEAVLDDDGHGVSDVHIRATVTKKGDSLTVDLSDSHTQVTGFINSSYPNRMSAVHMALPSLIAPRTPKNEGTFRPVTVKAKEGTVVWPYPPAPVTLSTNHCAQEIAEAMIKALAPSCPDRVLAGWSRRFRIAISGTNPRNKRKFIWHLFHARGGGGACSAGDGWETAGEGQAAGGVKFGSGGGGPGRGRDQIRLGGGRGDALPALLQAPRVPTGLGGRRALPRRRGLGARAAHGDERARARQHPGRWRPPLGLRGARRRGRAAPPLPPTRAGQDARAQDQGGRGADPARRGVPGGIDGRRRIRPAGPALVRVARRRPRQRFRLR